MAQTTGQNLPLPQSPFVNSDGTLSYDGYQYLLSLLADAESAQYTATVATGLEATGTNQATAFQLSNQWNVVDTVAAGSGVLLSSLNAGQTQAVFNANTLSDLLNVYPPPGVQIDALGANKPYQLAALKMQIFNFVSSGQIDSTQLG
jgi:hypothetical protein